MKYTALDESRLTNLALNPVLYLPLNSHFAMYYFIQIGGGT